MANSTPDVVSTTRCFGGTQYVFRHRSEATGTEMRFAAFVPPQGAKRKLPVVWFLAGLTCTEENFTVKAGAQRAAAELGLILIAPDTSPRGEGVPDDPNGAYDFGLGAGFYLDATQEPWAGHYRMEGYTMRDHARAAGHRRRRLARRHDAAGDHGSLDGRPRGAHLGTASSRPFRIRLRLRADRLADELPLG